jgi:hypothetical protein
MDHSIARCLGGFCAQSCTQVGSISEPLSWIAPECSSHLGRCSDQLDAANKEGTGTRFRALDDRGAETGKKFEASVAKSRTEKFPCARK